MISSCYECRVEAGWTCNPYGPTDGDIAGPSACVRDQTCGDGTVAGAEECDDGDNVNYDGCSAICKVEAGFTCDNTYVPSNCTEICGDGLHMGFLGCDDNNTINFDGCNEECSIEAGHRCGGGSRGSWDQCAEVWNDGLDFGEYECDQGNYDNADGCDQFG